MSILYIQWRTAVIAVIGWQPCLQPCLQTCRAPYLCCTYIVLQASLTTILSDVFTHQRVIATVSLRRGCWVILCDTVLLQINSGLGGILHHTVLANYRCRRSVLPQSTTSHTVLQYKCGTTICHILSPPCCRQPCFLSQSNYITDLFCNDNTYFSSCICTCSSDTISLLDIVNFTHSPPQSIANVSTTTLIVCCIMEYPTMLVDRHVPHNTMNTGSKQSRQLSTEKSFVIKMSHQLDNDHLLHCAWTVLWQENCSAPSTVLECFCRPQCCCLLLVHSSPKYTNISITATATAPNQQLAHIMESGPDYQILSSPKNQSTSINHLSAIIVWALLLSFHKIRVLTAKLSPCMHSRWHTKFTSQHCKWSHTQTRHANDTHRFEVSASLITTQFRQDISMFHSNHSNNEHVDLARH